MIQFSHAKINLGLYVTDRREDGFHNLESIFLPIDLRDAIELIPAKENGISLYGINIPGDYRMNSCLLTLDLLQKRFDIPNYHIHLLKNIPMGSGLGGGSGNSAYIMRMVNDKANLGLSTKEMQDIVLNIGSDNAFFIEDKPMCVKGRGEIMNPCQFNTSALKAVIIIPPVHRSTKEAYKHVYYERPMVELSSIKIEDLSSIKLINSFQDGFLDLFPKGRDVLESLSNAGAIYQSLSGSGSAFYGIFNKEDVISPELKSYADINGYQYFETEFL